MLTTRDPPNSFSVELHSPDLHLPPDVVRYAQEKVKVKLAKFGRRVTDVIIRIKDVNGSKGGVDKACHMEARLAALAPANVEECHADLRAAIDMAIERLEYTVHSHVERDRARRLGQGRRTARRLKFAF